MGRARCVRSLGAVDFGADRPHFAEQLGHVHAGERFVMVTRYEKGIAYVRPWEDVAGDHNGIR